MTEQNETQEIEPNTNESKVNEVIIVKKRTLVKHKKMVVDQASSLELLSFFSYVTLFKMNFYIGGLSHIHTNIKK